MQRAVHRFVQLLRARGLSISPGEALDALRALAAVPLTERGAVKNALAVTLVKETRDYDVFDEVFERYFRLQDLATPDGDRGHAHEHGAREPERRPDRVKISEEISETPDRSHSHGPPSDAADFFEEKDLATAFRLHQEASRVNLAAMSQELVLASRQDAVDAALRSMSQQISASRLRHGGRVGELAPDGAGAPLDVDLSVAAADLLAELDGLDVEPEAAEALRRQVAGLVDDLPELLRRYLARLLELGRGRDDRDHEVEPAYRTHVPESERAALEEALRRLGRQMRGALSHRRVGSSRGRIDVARTMRANMRYDGVPFRPVTAHRREDRPRLVVLADVSLSVRNTARFTLHLVHGLQSLFSAVRTFAFVSDLVEITEHFELHPVEDALGLVFGGELLDVDANSNYGRALEIFYDEHVNAVNRCTTVLVLGDGRGNGNPANTAALEAIRRRARQLVWITPEQRASWRL